MKSLAGLLIALLTLTSSVFADPQISSWYKDGSGSYARIYTSKATQAAGTAVTTWSRNAGVQSSPTYSGLHQIAHSNSWVYIRTTGLASHIMGPWYLDTAKTTDFPNFPANTAKIYRIPRTPIIPTTKTTTNIGSTGYYVNGVAMFDMTDTFTYSNSQGTDIPMGGDGVWVREAYYVEGVTFDPGFAHQAGSQYHYHAQPPGLRYQMGDHVLFDATTKTYYEDPAAPTKHSPILAWAADGLPVYGPYGYSSPLDATSGIRRMISGFQLRTITTRTTLSAWSARVHGSSTTLASNVYGPNVSSTYGLGYYIEDYEYLGDLGKTLGVDFDLNENNVRYCVTPEFPGGTWAYFCTIKADGTPVFPYACGRQFYGTPQGAEMTSYPETVTIDWNGGPNLTETPDAVDAATSDDVTITWNVAEGGTYLVQASDTLGDDWSAISTPTAASNVLTVTETSPKTAHPSRFYTISRTGLASFDSSGFDYTDPNATTYTFTFSGNLPPDTAPITGVTVGGVTGILKSYVRTGSSNPYTATISVSFVPTSLTAGQSYNAVLAVTGPPPVNMPLTFTSTNTYTKPSAVSVTSTGAAVAPLSESLLVAATDPSESGDTPASPSSETSRVFKFKGDLPGSSARIRDVQVGGVTGTVASYSVSGRTAKVAITFDSSSMTSGRSYKAKVKITKRPHARATRTFTSINAYRPLVD